MDPDPDVKRLQCLHNRRQTENQATSQWIGWKWNSSFFFFSFKRIALLFLNAAVILWVLSGSSCVHLHSHQRYFQLKPFQLSNNFKPKPRNICMKELWWEIRCFAAIIPNRIISTSGWTQYCSNMTSSHPSCDGVTTEILSVNMNQRDPHKSLLKRPWQHGHHLFMHTNELQTCSQCQFHLCCFCHPCLNSPTRLGDTMCWGGVRMSRWKLSSNGLEAFPKQLQKSESPVGLQLSDHSLACILWNMTLVLISSPWAP